MGGGETQNRTGESILEPYIRMNKGIQANKNVEICI